MHPKIHYKIIYNVQMFTSDMFYEQGCIIT